MYNIRNGSTVGFGNVADAYFNNAGGGLELPNAYNIVGGIAHHWNDKWQSSLYGAYFNYAANSTAVDTLYCGGMTVGAAPGNGAVNAISAGSVGAGCRDWSAWQIGPRSCGTRFPTSISRSKRSMTG